MLETAEEQETVRTRIVEALAAPGAPTPGQIASACGVTEQAVNNWKRTGKIRKANLATLAQQTGRPVERFLGQDATNQEPAKPAQKAADGAPSLDTALGAVLAAIDALDPLDRAMAATALKHLAEHPGSSESVRAKLSSILTPSAVEAKHPAPRRANARP